MDYVKANMQNGCLRIVRKHAKNVLAMKTKVSASCYVLIFFKSVIKCNLYSFRI